jgi:AAA family ATP:ADP antiporter
MMMSYYILKTIREPILLTKATAETKSYAAAATALFLLFIIPLYGLLFRHTSKQRLTRLITEFFLASLLIFILMGVKGVDISFAYYVWVGIFSVLITAQFWAFAADTYNVKSGQRLFPLIMVGATAGSLVAPPLSGALFPTLGPWWLMFIAMVLLALTLPCVSWARSSVPPGSRARLDAPDTEKKSGLLGGLGLVFTDRYLFLLALLIMLLNWVNTTGEYILAEMVVRQADFVVATQPGGDKGNFIAAFYGNFYFTVNALTLMTQVFLVSRIIRWIGVGGAILVLPLIAMFGYGLVVFIPVFSIIQVVKIIENSTDYSLMNTTRHALYLPLNASKKYEGKTTIEAFFWRFGDLAQAGGIYVGLNWFKFDVGQFALLNMVLAGLWLTIACKVGQLYKVQEKQEASNLPPQLVHSIEDRFAPAGKPFFFELPENTFVDPDEGDVLTISAHLVEDAELPPWLEFDPELLAFSGRPPSDVAARTQLILRATDFDGAWAEGQLCIFHYDRVQAEE